MYRYLSIKTLGTLFSVLLVWVVIIKWIDSSNGENTLPSTLVSLNANDVYTIRIKPRNVDDEIVLSKLNDLWQVSQSGQSFDAAEGMANSLVEQISNLKPLRLSAKSEDKWDHFEVTDSLATKVIFESNGKELANIYIGKFSYRINKHQQAQQNHYMQQPQGNMNTYVRLHSENEVYAVEGFLASSFNQDINAFRNKTITHLNTSDITELKFDYPADSSYVLMNNNGKWMIDGLKADSIKVAKYLNGIKSIKGTSFSDSNLNESTFKLTINGDNMQAVFIKGYFEGDKASISSSQNKDAIFEEHENTFHKIYQSKDEFIN